MQRIAAPMIGGMLTSAILTLLVIPAIYMMWRWHGYVKKSLQPIKSAPSRPVVTDREMESRYDLNEKASLPGHRRWVALPPRRFAD